MVLTAIIAKFVGEKLNPFFDKVAAEFGEEIKHLLENNILEYQIEEYGRNSSTKTLLHRVQPKNLKEFYQPLFISPCGKKYRPSHTRPNSKRIPTNSVKELFSKNKLITLIGNAGSGKSTIVKYLFLNSIDSDYKIPIKVELRYMNDFDGSVIEFIRERIFKLNKLATSDRIIERLMSSGDFIIFLDGYDEITSTKKEKITKEIDELVQVYNRNNYLLTSRPYTDIELLPLFHNFEVCELSDDDINQFIKKQIPKEEYELCEKIIEAVNNQENISYKSFLSNPLLLSMFILTFQSYSSIPQKRSEFYSQVFDALYSVHDSMSKLAFVREKQSGLSKEQFVEVLKLFSFLSYFDEKFIFSSIYLEEKLALIKEKKKGISFDNDKLISDLQIAIGILNKEGTEYTFPHRSLQEYFAAIYIYSLNEENKKIIFSKIISSLTDKKKYRQTYQDNFYLLLSELDEKSVIQYALIPYFEKYITEINVDETDKNLIIDNFITLRSLFDSFNYILKSNELNEAYHYFSECYSKYRGDKDINKMTEEEREKHMDERREKLAMQEIKPFMKKFIPKLEKIKTELNNFLISENKSDNEIISLF
ncbi:NACHT domain-containing protein [Flavobacterium fontis]|uniref:NACHT domain-containing protein n=1 Tax=Flavobacterium fontis TaxID=1124188 RepID=A0A1M4ZKC2_9FLAO|nr:NACHT domain-containing protein [Flavobacterium fontis]SHF18418.1 NACHT domain-containing protein [Flavobacterium fontis]